MYYFSTACLGTSPGPEKRRWNVFSSSYHAAKTTLLVAIIGEHKFNLKEVVPGTDLTVDDILQIGLFQYDETRQKLTVAYIWLLLILDSIEMPELKSLIAVDHDELMGKTLCGSHTSLLTAAFEEFWCNFRVVRSRCHEARKLMNWSSIYSGAYFT